MQSAASGHQAQKPSILPAVFGALVLLGAAAFIGWGIWQAMTPVPVPLQGMMDATTVSVSAKVPGRIAAISVREGDQVQATRWLVSRSPKSMRR